MLKSYISQQQHPFTTEYQDISADKSVIFVVIPCFNEPDIVTTLNSLNNCDLPDSQVTIIIVINSSDSSSESVFAQNRNTLKDIAEWKANTHYWFQLEVLHAEKLPHKWAGVGWARKIGMDEAVRHIAENGKKDGIIVAFDADSLVRSNYLSAIEKAFKNHPKHNFFTIHFEHPVEDNSIPAKLREGIIRYELHMRYFRNAMEWCGYPHAIHTVGSSMAVRASAYAKQGGMNRRKAGEDFYFLHKLVLLGSYGNINSTCVIPAIRTSDRVPFGTGAALKKWDEGDDELFTTYSFDSFEVLKPFFQNPEHFYEMDKTAILQKIESFHTALSDYILNINTVEDIIELQSNCSNPDTFGKRFFHRINAFWIIQYLNNMETTYFQRGELMDEANKLLIHMGIETKTPSDPLQLLNIFRELDLRTANNH